MMSLMNRNGLTLAATLLLISAGSGWLAAARDTTTPPTYAMMAAVLAAMMAIAINVSKNGGADINGEPVLREARAVGSSARLRIGPRRSARERISNVLCPR
jgi:hypothetical protein